MSTKQFYMCSCFFSRNIFLEKYKIHVAFDNKQQFLQDYGQILEEKGCSTAEQIDFVLNEITDEITRRKDQDALSFERKQTIASKYTPLHPHIYTLEESFLSSEFLQLVLFCKQDGVTMEELHYSPLIHDLSERIYSFSVFTEQFSQLFLEELTHFEESDMPKGRPNTMNNYGILLSELGFDEKFITPLRENFLIPLCVFLYPDCGGKCLNSHRAFIVTYKPDQDISLPYHYDNAEVTLNVSLGKTFVGGSLVFCGVKNQKSQNCNLITVQHNPCTGVLHRGLHLHSAQPILSGERYNLIIWMRSSYARNSLCPRCDKPPSLIPSLGFGDGFT